MDASLSPLISLRHVGKSFKDGEVRAIEDISFDVRPGEFVSLVGPSGCGKTTILRLINGLITPDEGEVRVMGAAPEPGPDLAMVFQSARLMPWRTVAGNIEFALALRGLNRKDRQERALALLGAVGLRDFANAYPHELSGGMQQRVGLARALSVEPKVLLMDEPFAALDAMTREVLRNELLQMWSERRMAIVFVTHDIEEAVLLSQRIVLLRPRPGRVDEVVDVDLPEPRWQKDPRPLPAFIEMREHLWNRIRGMAADGVELEELAGAFPRLGTPDKGAR
ncbi:ABC transporter ATP-binding protein [Paradevosia shaoguanensis]|uniref:ABC transporter ATP-binding protein n=1 Tax=Paradevosia shaoguanensis TaxID=1335043 RepID=A0AA41QME6_9HYPH|nr:ABC transporter ATP-binding protein [Paradevosia shaoguanensis]MCF1742796.1 ABC transporter ATP-binding protein [Paradevosia shaoguanensis]MCI0127279.1 ABC transporter ATP-binding protein [Paradevosia shaoguanensis]